MAADGGFPGDWARPVVHWEIEARDPDLIRAFYAQLFGWNIGDGPIMNIAAGIGGPEDGVGGHNRGSGNSRGHPYRPGGGLRTAPPPAGGLGGALNPPPVGVPRGTRPARGKGP